MSTTARLGTLFGARLPLVEAAAAAFAADLVTSITDESRAAIKAIITTSIRDGIPPLSAARSIRSIVGLSTPAALAVVNYRAELVANGLAPDKVEAKARSYADKLRRQRAKLIASTETMRALNAGQHEAWQQARAAGLISSSAQRRWLATGAGTRARLCPRCAALNGQTAPLDEPFPGGVQAPPAHPGCRCAVVLEP